MSMKKTTNYLTATVRGKLLKGNNFNSTIGAVAKDVINAQVAPLIKAVKITVATK